MPLVEEIVAWIAAAPASPRVSAHTPIAPVPPVDRARHHTPEGDVSELLVRFADLPGVLTEPIGPRGRSARPAVVLFNVGANHRVGCNRLYVGMARLLATAGFSVLRFDRRTIGDGPHAPGEPENDIYAARSVDEARAAMDFLRDAHGFDRFVLGGLCSGGYVAYHAAIVDERVVGAFLINPLTYDWKLGDSLEVRVRKTFKSTKFYSQALRGTDVWKRALTGQVHVRAVLGELARRAIKRSGTVADDLRARLMRRGRNESDVARNLRRLCDRGVDLFFVFGAADGGIDLIEEHLGPDAKALRRHKRFRMEIIDGPDHTFTPLWSQRHLRLLLRAHLRARFG
jgi:pimeloyl-ACP methyl ester carboxylesterase